MENYINFPINICVMRRAILASFAAVSSFFAISAYEKKCRGTPFKFYDRMVCPDCLTATIDGQVEYGDNIEHYPELKQMSGGCADYVELTISGDCEYAYLASHLVRSLAKFPGYVTLHSSTSLPFKKRDMVYRLKEDPESLILGNEEYYLGCGVEVRLYDHILGDRAVVKSKSCIKLNRVQGSNKSYSLVISSSFGTPNAYRKKGFCGFTNLEDFRRLQEALKAKKSIHIIGGSSLSVELYYEIKKNFPDSKLTMTMDMVAPGLKDYVPKEVETGLQFTEATGYLRAGFEG